MLSLRDKTYLSGHFGRDAYNVISLSYFRYVTMPDGIRHGNVKRIYQQILIDGVITIDTVLVFCDIVPWKVYAGAFTF